MAVGQLARHRLDGRGGFGLGWGAATEGAQTEVWATVNGAGIRAEKEQWKHN